jgi:nitronate monooxygenase
MNALIEKSSRSYHERLVRWMDIALEEGVRFFITSLGNPRWVVDRAAEVGGIVYHDVTNRSWAEKAAQNGVRGLIAVNSEAGGHPGKLGPQALLEEVSPLGLPVVCAGGVGDAHTFRAMMDLGYDGVQLGTRFIASAECRAHPDYKRAIVSAEPRDIVLTERLTGLPVAVLNNDYIQRLGLRAGPIARYMLRHRKMKYWMRAIYAATSHRRLKQSSLSSAGAREYWQAGKSVAGIRDIRPVREIVEELAAALR